MDPIDVEVRAQVLAACDAKEGTRVFKALSAKGKVTMPFQETFWSPGFGMLVDQFGTPWIINCDKAE